MLQPKYVFFMGIGGIGMSAIARYYNTQGATVAGYDKTPSPLTAALQAEGIQITFDDSIDALPEYLWPGEDRSAVLVIYTPAIPAQSRLLVYFQNNGFNIVKRSKALGVITQPYPTIAVAGTHGKTSTSTLVAHIFKQAGLAINAFLGGISTNYGVNFMVGQHPIHIVEADEFDRSFLQLYPQTAIITSMDADHLDIYGSTESIQQAYLAFAAQVQPGGFLVVHVALPQYPKVSGVTTYTYGNSGDWNLLATYVENETMFFDLQMPSGEIVYRIACGVPGYHNVENAVAAFAVAALNGLNVAQIKAGIASYLGVKRRFEQYITQENNVYIDDYAHHPTEINALLNAVKQLYPGKTITALFQPHLYSRTQDFMQGFADALSKVDVLGIMPIYPARELPIPGVTSEALLQKVQLPAANKTIVEAQDVLQWLAHQNAQVVLTIGAGDIDRLCVPIAEQLKQGGSK